MPFKKMQSFPNTRNRVAVGTVSPREHIELVNAANHAYVDGERDARIPFSFSGKKMAFAAEKTGKAFVIGKVQAAQRKHAKFLLSMHAESFRVLPRIENNKVAWGFTPHYFKKGMGAHEGSSPYRIDRGSATEKAKIRLGMMHEFDEETPPIHYRPSNAYVEGRGDGKLPHDGYSNIFHFLNVSKSLAKKITEKASVPAEAHDVTLIHFSVTPKGRTGAMALSKEQAESVIPQFLHLVKESMPKGMREAYARGEVKVSFYHDAIAPEDVPQYRPAPFNPKNPDQWKIVAVVRSRHGSARAGKLR